MPVPQELLDRGLRDTARAGDLAKLQNLLQQGAAVDSGNVHGQRPLHYASAKGHADCVQALLAAGAAPEATDVDGKTPLDKAKDTNHPACTALLVDITPEPAGGAEPEPEPEPEPAGAGDGAGAAATNDVEADSVKVVRLGGTVGDLRIDEAYWSDDPLSRGAGTGATLWDGSVLLAGEVVRLAGQGLLSGVALELGAGCSGVPSLAASRLGCFDVIIATDGGSEDIEDNLMDLRRNLDANGAAGVQVKRLEWGAAAADEFALPLDCILASEVIYLPACVPLLLQTLAGLSGAETVLLMYISERDAKASAAWWAQMPALFEHERLGPPLAGAAASDLKEQQRGVFRLRKMPAAAVNGYGVVAVDLAAEAAALKAARMDQEAVGWEAGGSVNAQGKDKPPPVAMKKNKETGELEEFHSTALQDDLPDEEEETVEIEIPCGDDY